MRRGAGEGAREAGVEDPNSLRRAPPTGILWHLRHQQIVATEGTRLTVSGHRAAHATPPSREALGTQRPPL